MYTSVKALATHNQPVKYQSLTANSASTRANFRKATELAPVSPTRIDICHAYKPNRQSPCDRKANHRDRSNAHTKPVCVRSLASDGLRGGSMGELHGLAAPPQWKLAPLHRGRRGANFYLCSPSISAQGVFLHRRRYMGALPPAKAPF